MTENNNLNEEIDRAEEIYEAEETADETAEETAEDKASTDPEKKKKKQASEGSAGYLLRLIGTLTAICVTVAILLGAINAVTSQKINDNITKSKKESVLSIFEKGKDCELYKTLENGSEIYLVYRENGIVGYCVFVSTTGFGGNIELMVGINCAYATEGVRIVSMNETPGVGTKTNSMSFLSLFKGSPHNDPVGNADAIAGATVSSEAVKAGVIDAHSAEIDLSAICAEKGMELLTPEMLEKITDEVTSTVPIAPSDTHETDDPEVTEPDETDPVSPDTDTVTSEPAETEDIPFVNNPGKQNFNYNVDASSGSDRFVIEIPKDEETATFETTTEPETTPEPVVTEPAPIVTEPAPIVTEPSPIVTDPEPTEPETTDDPNEIPPWLDTQPDETLPSWLDTQEEETMPSWIGG